MDWRKPLLGVGIAAAMGVLLGGAMRPQLGVGDRPEGPQMFAGWSGTRSTGPFDDGMTLAYSSGPLPDYVTGTDWKQTTSWPQQPQVTRHDPDADYGSAAPTGSEPSAPIQYAGSHWQEAPAEAPLYPSVSGGVRYDHPRTETEATPAPPPPPEFDTDVMPEATGDTSVVAES